MSQAFADPRLELAVRAAMPQDVLAQPLSALTRLDAANLGIRRLRGIEQLTELRWLDLSRNPLMSVAELGAATKLIRLQLGHTEAPTLAGLDGLPDLEDLDLYGSRVLTIEAITGLPSLRSLDLGLCIVRDLRPLASLTRLESLTLGNPSLHMTRRSVFSSSDPVALELAPLAQLTNLRQLRLYGLRLTSLEVLSELVSLEELVLDRCEFADSMRSLPRLPRLELLDLARTAGVDLRVLAEQPRLRALSLDEAALPDVSPLLACQNLELVSLRGIDVGGRQSLSRLHGLPRLLQLRIDNHIFD